MTTQKLRIVYMGSPNFAVPAFHALLQAGYTIPLVITQPDKPKGRKKLLTPTAVKEAALACGIPVITPENVNTPQVLAEIQQHRPDVLVVTAFGQILKKPLLALAPKGAINIHASLLPEYRGAAPIHRAIIAGKTITGITTMFMDVGLDTGDMILQATTKILPLDTTETLRVKLANLGAELILETLNLVALDLVPRQAQIAEQATYAKKITRETEKICWQKSAVEIHNLIRGLTPDTSGFTLYEEVGGGQKSLKIWLTETDAHTAASKAGTVLLGDKTGLWVATPKGTLKLLEIQPEGKARMKAVDWWRGQGKNYKDQPLVLL